MLLSKLKNVATGEINWSALLLEMVVVFLGVTAGFLLNNWQSERAAEDLKQKYIIDFTNDTEANIEQLSESLQEDSLWMNRARPLIIMIGKKQLPADSANAAVRLITQLDNSSYQTSAYENITNSGNLNLIEDYALRKQIVDYYLAIEGMTFIQEYFKDYFNEFVLPFIFAHYQTFSAKLSDPAVRNTTQFQNVHLGYFSMVQQSMAARQELLAKSMALKEALERR